MESADLSRRSLLQAIAATLASAALPLGWAEVALAMDHVHAAPRAAADAKLTFFSTAEALDVDAVVAQIIPGDDGSPGAREAGAATFIDRSLATYFSQLGADYRTQLAAFQAGYRERHPAAASFAALTPAQQIEHLKTIDETPFFATTRLLTLLGLFALPQYGGNRDGIGWKMIGFEDRHMFQPPFGHYDRDYPGFVIERMKSK